MWSNSSLLDYLPIASFALAAGGIAVRFIPLGRAKLHLMAACLFFVLVLSGVLWQQHEAEQHDVRVVAEEVVGAIGNDKRTLEEIVITLRKPDYVKVDKAIDFLSEQKRIGSESVPIVNKSDGKPYQIRLFFVRSFQ